MNPSKLLVPFIVPLLCGAPVAAQQQMELQQKLTQHVTVLASDSLEGRGLGTLGKEKARDYIVARFKETGIEPLGSGYLHRFSTKMHLAWVNGQNVVGVVKGSDPALANEYILIGAHYDHLGYDLEDGTKTIFPGADDNASGVASMIELGSFFAQNPQLLKRSLLLVAFDAEESGLLGSKQFIADTVVAPSQIKAMFSIDMVGMLQKHESLDLDGIETIQEGRELVADLALKHNITISGYNDRIVPNTDTAPFGEIGIPSVHVFTGTVSPYHKPGDKSELLDYEGMASVNLLMRDVVADLAQRDSLSGSDKFLASKGADKANPEAAQPLPAKASKIIFGLRLNNGWGHHNYNNEFFDAKSVYNFEGGFYSQIKLSKYLTLQPEVLYDYNGSRHPNGRFKRQSVTVPLNLMLGSKATSSKSNRIFVFAGAFYRYNLSGKIGGNDMDFDLLYNRDEWGFDYGLIFQADHFQMGWVFRKTLTPLAPKPATEISAVSSMVSMGWIF